MSTLSIPASEWTRIAEAWGEGDLAGPHAPDVGAGPGWALNAPVLAVGDTGYLVERSHELGRAPTTWALRPEPGRSNLNHEQVVEGWLGTIDDVRMQAHGYVRVTHIGPRVIRVQPVPLVDLDGQQVSHEELLAERAVDLAEARSVEDAARAALAAAVAAAASAGVSKYRIGQVTGLARDTVDKWAADGQRSPS